MRAMIPSATAVAFLLLAPAQAIAGQTSVCQDQRGYTYNTPGRCRSGDTRLDFYRTIRSNAHPDACQEGCVISRFREGDIVVESGDMSQSQGCFLAFRFKSPWGLMADFARDDRNEFYFAVLIPDFDAPRAGSEFFAVTDESTTVTYRFTDLLGAVTPDKCHFEATVRRRIHR